MVKQRTPRSPPSGRAASAFVAHCLEMLAPLGAVRARAMFGGHGLYLEDLFFAIVAAERLYLKADATTEPQFVAAGCEPFVYEGQGKAMRMGYWSVPPEALDSPEAMQPWARLAVQAALAARAAKLGGTRRETRKPVQNSRR